MGIRPAKDLSWSHTPDTAEDSKPTAELPLLLRPVATLQPRISAAERSRSLYFRCKKQQKQLVLRGIHTIHQAMTHHRSYQIRYTGESRCPRQKWIPAFEGVTQSRFWRDVSPCGMLNLGVYTKVQYLPTWIGPSIAWMGMALLMRPAAVMRLPASPLLLPRQCGDAACWPSTG